MQLQDRPGEGPVQAFEGGGLPMKTLWEHRYDGGTECVRDARDAVVASAAPYLDDDDIDTVRLLTSELVGNSFIHGHGAVRVSVARSTQYLAITVTDDGDGTVAVRERDTARPGGYGMYLVETLSAGWQQLHAADGTSVRYWMKIQDQQPQ